MFKRVLEIGTLFIYTFRKPTNKYIKYICKYNYMCYN